MDSGSYLGLRNWPARLLWYTHARAQTGSMPKHEPVCSITTTIAFGGFANFFSNPQRKKEPLEKCFANIFAKKKKNTAKRAVACAFCNIFCIFCPQLCKYPTLTLKISLKLVKILNIFRSQHYSNFNILHSNQLQISSQKIFLQLAKLRY